MNDRIDIPDGWSPELALAVSGLLAALESAIWRQYGDQMMPLIAGVELPELMPVAHPTSIEERGEDDRVPF